jgi:hypothetical protein
MSNVVFRARPGHLPGFLFLRAIFKANGFGFNCLRFTLRQKLFISLKTDGSAGALSVA